MHCWQVVLALFLWFYCIVVKLLLCCCHIFPHLLYHLRTTHPWAMVKFWVQISKRPPFSCSKRFHFEVSDSNMVVFVFGTDTSICMNWSIPCWVWVIWRWSTEEKGWDFGVGCNDPNLHALKEVGIGWRLGSWCVVATAACVFGVLSNNENLLRAVN